MARNDAVAGGAKDPEKPMPDGPDGAGFAGAPGGAARRAARGRRCGTRDRGGPGHRRVGPRAGAAAVSVSAARARRGGRFASCRRRRDRGAAASSRRATAASDGTGRPACRRRRARFGTRGPLTAGAVDADAVISVRGRLAGGQHRLDDAAGRARRRGVVSGDRA